MAAVDAVASVQAGRPGPFARGPARGSKPCCAGYRRSLAGMLPQLPEPVRHPSPAPDRRASLARAAVSPSAIIVTAAGFRIGLAAQSLTLAIVLGVVAWLGRMVVALRPRRRRSASRRRPSTRIAVSEPWRQYVRQALGARQRFDQTVSQWPAGPLHDRLLLLQPRIGQATEEVWAVAQQGAALDGTVRGVPTGATRPSMRAAVCRTAAESRPSGSRTRRRTARPPWPAPRRPSPPSCGPRTARKTTRAEVLDRLRLLTARLDEAVTQLLALGLDRRAGRDRWTRWRGRLMPCWRRSGPAPGPEGKRGAAASVRRSRREAPPGAAGALPPPEPS